MRRCSTLLSILLLVPAASAAGQQEVSGLGPGLERLVERVQERYRDTVGLEARFVQRSFSRFGALTKEASGVLTIRSPGNLRMEYDDGQLFVVSGDEMILYRPRRNQVQIRPFGQERTENAPVLYLTGQGDLLQDFHIEPGSWRQALAPDNVQLRLTPRRRGSTLEALILEVAPMSARVVRLVQMEAVGSNVEYRFHDVRTNVEIADSVFEFEVPEGADVVRVGG